MSEANATPGLYSSRPTTKIDSREQPGLDEGLLALLVEETAAGLYRCELTVGNWGSGDGGTGFLYFNRSLLDFGKPIEVAMGAGDAAGTVFKGRIMGLEGRYPQARPPELAVLAEDRLQDLRMTRRTRTFEQMDDAAVFQQIASQHGLRAVVDVTGPQHRVLAQLNQSDLAFMRERSRRIDAELWIDGDELHVQGRDRRRGETVSLTYGQRLQEFMVLADLANQRTSVTATGWDVSAKEVIRYEAGEEAIRAELEGKTGGGATLQRALGARKEQLATTVPLTDEEARVTATAAYRQMARQFLTGAGVCEGDARIRVGSYVELHELGPLFDGKYYVTEARHLFDSQRGYRTQFRVERPWIGD